ncbi:c-type cytochrome [Mangrovicella endophytica]|uniref:c-type cytochrome n=1 Tax=Mangrovicella endophytica TaxID=2066697 RepID=UPI001FDF20A5|nr:cytochrome c [Mangrovicella endophytica]
MRRAIILRPAAAVLVASALAGCREDMEVQPKLTAYSSAAAFDQNMAARQPPTGTLDREALEREAALGRPPAPSEALIRRGAERYKIACTPCHGEAGLGDGIVVQRGFPQPPAFTEPRLLAADASHVVDVITHGWGVMYPYENRVAPADRWAIALYVRALQLAQTGKDAADPAPAQAVQR